MKEVTLNTDSFNQNPQLTGETAILRHIYNLIVMKKGTDPLNPDKGCDVFKHYFQFKDDVDLRALEQEIKDQITKYTDYLINNVNCHTVKRANKWILHIILTIASLQNALVVSTNGEYATYTEIDSLTKEIIKEVNESE